MKAVTVTPGRKVTKKPKLSPFKKLRLRVALSVEDCADLAGVSVRTVQRWDIQGAPLIAHRLLEIYDRQDLSGHGSAWRGFRFSRGKLVCGKLSFTPHNLKQVPHYIDLYNRVESARIRYYKDGLLIERCMGIVFASQAFDALPFLPD